MLDEIRTRYDLSILISTHDFATLHKYADKVILLKQKVLQDGHARGSAGIAGVSDSLLPSHTEKGGDAQ